jgi:hypothetical protein
MDDGRAKITKSIYTCSHVLNLSKCFCWSHPPLETAYCTRDSCTRCRSSASMCACYTSVKMYHGTVVGLCVCILNVQEHPPMFLSQLCETTCPHMTLLHLRDRLHVTLTTQNHGTVTPSMLGKKKLGDIYTARAEKECSRSTCSERQAL